MEIITSKIQKHLAVHAGTIWQRGHGQNINLAGNDTCQAQEFVRQIYKQTKVLDSGARGSTTTFAERGIGDVLLAWENEAYLAVREQPGKFEIITPSLSLGSTACGDCREKCAKRWQSNT